jgi:predicted RNA binding protein YcfA (HicA-like mRNA interferase family)
LKLPRDVSGRQLAAALGRLGYEITRQTGSHIRVTTQRGGEHHLTIPDHDSLKVGTLSAILRDVSSHSGLARDALIRTLFS